MNKTNAPLDPSYLQSLDRIIEAIVAPAAYEVDELALFPRAAIRALGDGGLLGLVSASEVGGLGQSFRGAGIVVERLAQACASTAMIVCMHYAAAAVIEAHGSLSTRGAIARGRHLSTLAFSESGSRSHFWAPLSSAEKSDNQIVLNAHKGWVTSAGQAQSYVWSSRPVAAEGKSTLWLVPADASGLRIPAPFDGLGLRGNCSAQIVAENTVISAESRLGADGAGFDIMMGIVLPYFQIMNASFSVGLMDGAVKKTIQHVTGTKLENPGQSLAELPTIRAYLSHMQIKTDSARALLMDAIDALEQGREDSTLRVLEVKAAAGDASAEVTDLAMRICGGAAFRKDIGVQRNFRDARAALVMAPTSDVLYDFIGKALCGLPLFQ